jgi:hypothetical protein
MEGAAGAVLCLFYLLATLVLLSFYKKFLTENFTQVSFLSQRACKQGLMVLSLIGFQHVFWGHFQPLSCLNGGEGLAKTVMHRWASPFSPFENS